MAIITRWRMPPDSSKGYQRRRCSGEGMPDRAEQLDGGLPGRDRSMSRWSRRLSVIWSPMRLTGLRAVIGSWKIMLSSAPHTWRSWSGDMAVRSWPAKCTVPERTTSWRGRRPMIDRASTVLPDPDSPTTPSVSPASKLEGDAVDGPDRPSGRAEGGVEVVDPEERAAVGADVGEVGPPTTAAVAGVGSQKAFADVEPLAESVADEVDGQEEEEHGEGRPHHDVGVGLDQVVGGALGDDVAPRRGGQRDRQPRKASEPSRTMMTATLMRAKVRATGATLGRISRKMIRRVEAPSGPRRDHEVAVGESQRSRRGPPGRGRGWCRPRR